MSRKKILWLLVILSLLCFGWGLFMQYRSVKAPAKPTEQIQKTTNGEAEPKNSVATFDKSAHSTDDPASVWTVVNKLRPLAPKTYAPDDLVAVGGGQQLRQAAATALQKMLAAAQAAGYTVTPASGYRSYERQVSVYNSEVQSYGQAVADSESARPGYSEHQTGLAIDLASGGCSITDCFGDTPGGRWVTEHAADYGFLLRYPTGQQAVTGYRPESWHFRYIGTELAQEMARQQVTTLETFFNLPAAPDYAN